MKYDELDKVKDLYDKGYKCIKYEDGLSGEFSIYLKNFEKEQIEEMIVNNSQQIQSIKNFIDSQ